MTVQTISEQLFEMHCKKEGVTCTRIAEDGTKVADYSVELANRQITVEIKQLDSNTEDLLYERSSTSGLGGDRIAPTKRVRNLLAKAYNQLKGYARKDIPCLVVLYNNSGHINHIDDFTVSTAMFGTFGLVLGITKDRIMKAVGQGFGGDRKLTKNTCRGISAVCVITQNQDGTTSLKTYHNPYARNPIDPIDMAIISDEQFKHDDPHSFGFAQLMPQKI